MPIIVAKDYAEVYRWKALVGTSGAMNDREEFSTEFICENILSQLNIVENSTILDIGCGDGTLLKMVYNKIRSGLGTNANSEETHWNMMNSQSYSRISFTQGLCDNLFFVANDSFDYVICNSVIPLLSTKNDLQRCLDEIFRIAKPGATIWLGEVMVQDEMSVAREAYGESISRWLFYTLFSRGFAAAKSAFIRVIKCYFGSDIFIIQPKNPFVISPQELIFLAKSSGLIFIKGLPHREQTNNGRIIQWNTRENFIFCKPQPI